MLFKNEIYKIVVSAVDTGKVLVKEANTGRESHQVSAWAGEKRVVCDESLDSAIRQASAVFSTTGLVL